ncbi:COR domain-containing protein [Carboxylicivirga sp. N1Y90]|uniref:COR domain-containing protein n=1 Tax=Carboxylicivirga fragile TaxID=3417571 RepID=UPI003D34E54E|nr:GTP-binding protein [Marinilabiliaceae bacterium N1Y90]
MKPDQIALERILEAEKNGSKLLDLYGLGIKKIPKEIGKCYKLKNIRAWSNKISLLPKEIENLTQLETLYLSGNEIEYLPKEIGDLTNLRELYLGGNRLKEIPIELTLLKRLKKLMLSSNNLTELPIEFVNLKLYSFDLSKNPLIKPPIEIANKSMSSIKNYFASISNAQELYNLREAKLLIVGEGGVGKTCLMEKLIDSTFTITDSMSTTEGIDIKRWTLPIDSNSSVDINIWDFGGQEIYHSTHQFFLTKRSIYLFLWTARTDDDSSGRFEYWLNAIKLLSDDSPLIIVQNKIDERIKLIDEKTIKSQYPNVVGFINLSVKTEDGLSELMNMIKFELSRLPHLGDVLPKAWVEIRNELECLDLNYISYSDYLAKCKKYSLTETKAGFLARYFHDLGVFLHFHENSILKSTVFLKPQWATNAVYKIIDTRDVQLNNGKFSFNELSNIWHDYPIQKFFHLLELMKKFELCFQIINSQDFIVPNLLPPTQPEYTWDKKINLKLEYHYDFMPAGIISRFIVRNSDLIKENIYWKNGVVIRRENVEAEIISHQFDKKLKIRIKGKNKKGLLSIIRRELENIHKTQNYPDVTEMIPCTCDDCKTSDNPFFHSNDKLIKAKRKKKFKVQCQNSFDDVDIDKLLDGVGSLPKSILSGIVNIYGNNNEINLGNTEVQNQRVYRGNQQLVEVIINDVDNNISSKDKALVQLILDNTKTDAEKELLLGSLSTIKSKAEPIEKKNEASSTLRNFLNTSVLEAGKQIVKELITNGADYLGTIL